MSDFSSVDPNEQFQVNRPEDTGGGPPNPSGEQVQPQGALKHVREALEQTTKEKREAEQEVAQLRRELAIQRSALPDFPGKQFFIENYAGEPNPEAIRAAAEAAGFQLGEPSTGEPADEPAAPAPAPVTASELQAHRAVVNVAAGSSGGGDIDLNQALLAASSPAEVRRIIEEAQAQGIPGLVTAPTILG